MSTNAVTRFSDENGKTVAAVYTHWDGYPSNMLPLFERFFDTVESQTRDTRFDDAVYLSAKFLVFMAGEFNNSKTPKDNPLDFLSVGIVPVTDKQEYIYHIRCGLAGRPVVSCVNCKGGGYD
ncbi:MAG: hypothetical protein WC965_01220 [Thiohalomonadaceae bacterium]